MNTEIERNEHFPDPEGRVILAALTTRDLKNHDDFTTTTRLYVLEMWAKECGSWGHPAYQVRRKAFWDGAGKVESVWFFSPEDALVAWEQFAGQPCPETPSGLKILAAERQAA